MVRYETRPRSESYSCDRGICFFLNTNNEIYILYCTININENLICVSQLPRNSLFSLISKLIAWRRGRFLPDPSLRLCSIPMIPLYWQSICNSLPPLWRRPIPGLFPLKTIQSPIFLPPLPPPPHTSQPHPLW